MPVPYELKGKRILLLGATGVVLSYTARFLLELNRLYGLNIQVVCHGRSKDRLESLFSDLLHEGNIYFEVFDLEPGVPTYGYELAQAVKDGYLVDFLSVETKLKFIEEGIVYADLSEEDKERYESTFEMEDGELPESISSSALNSWIFNEDTIRQVLHILMTEGLTIDYGQKIGKTIIFAKNHDHAEKILEVFNKNYPHLNNYAQVIDNRINFFYFSIT